MSDFIEDVRKIVNAMLDDIDKAADEFEAADKEFDDLLKPLVDAVANNLDAADATAKEAQKIVEGVFGDFEKMAVSLEKAGKDLSDLAEPLAEKIANDIKEANAVHEAVGEGLKEILTRDPVDAEDIAAAAKEASEVAALDLDEEEDPCECDEHEDDTAADSNE
ncbi:MAG: hypothetical protein Q4D34_03310 [Eggerthellaceae bacterium]|nr:hypothetical protein [Eggerthellaceae bacterium]